MNPRREQFTCTITRDSDGRVESIVVDAVDLEDGHRQTRLNGTKAVRVAAAVHDIVRRSGVSGRTWTGAKPFELDPVSGAQLELLALSVKPLRRGDRIDQVADGVSTMSREEASYWGAKAHRTGGLRALRVLLTAGCSR